MKLGVTGTRSGMNLRQFAILHNILKTVIKAEPVSELHHGDCVGVDVEVAILAQSLGFKIVCHPPIIDVVQAFHKSDVFMEPLTYFARNRKIVEMTDRLLVVPYQDTPQKSGGTWYTHDYAVKLKKPLTIIYPKHEETK